jgi:hypothetical protein
VPEENIVNNSNRLCIRRSNLKYLDREKGGANLKKKSATQIYSVIVGVLQFNQIVDCVLIKIANDNLVDGFYIRFPANKSGKKSD